MANEQVRVDLTANDQASRKIDDVAESAEKLERLDPEVTVEADDNASPKLDAVAEAAESLDRLSPEVDVGADVDAARRGLADVEGDVEALTRGDHELVLKARIDSARAELKGLRDDLDDTAAKAKRVDDRLDDVGRTQGPHLAGNSVADLTGPLGDASSAASDIAGVFDGLGDVAGNMAARVGGDAEKMAGAITGIGFAVTAAAATWAYFRQKQQAAREKQEELVKGQREFNKAVAEGDRAAAAAKFVDMYGDVIDKAVRAGASVEDVTRFIRGQTDAIPALVAKTNELADARDNFATSGKTIDELNAEDRALRDVTDSVDDARASYSGTNSELGEQDRRLRDVSRALGVAEASTDGLTRAQREAEAATSRTADQVDRLRGTLDVDQAMLDFKRSVIDAMDATGQSALDQQGDVLALKQTIVDMGEDLKRNPLEIAAVLDDVDQGNLQAVAQTVESWYKNRPVQIAALLKLQNQALGQSSIPGYVLTPQSAAAPSIGVLNMTLPAGWRGDPVKAAHVQRRRAGRYYARTG